MEIFAVVDINFVKMKKQRFSDSELRKKKALSFRAHLIALLYKEIIPPGRNTLIGWNVNFGSPIGRISLFKITN